MDDSPFWMTDDGRTRRTTDGRRPSADCQFCDGAIYLPTVSFG
ncbi:MAG: hypothetical protein NTZ50_14915 [Chloroflexi bacterium]|nr:hypothetical protein [Chloroflexota bacterium]